MGRGVSLGTRPFPVQQNSVGGPEHRKPSPEHRPPQTQTTRTILTLFRQQERGSLLYLISIYQYTPSTGEASPATGRGQDFAARNQGEGLKRPHLFHFPALQILLFHRTMPGRQVISFPIGPWSSGISTGALCVFRVLCGFQVFASDPPKILCNRESFPAGGRGQVLPTRGGGRQSEGLNRHANSFPLPPNSPSA